MIPVSDFKRTQTGNFKPPSSGYGQDWVLVLDDAAKQYPKL